MLENILKFKSHLLSNYKISIVDFDSYEEALDKTSSHFGSYFLKTKKTDKFSNYIHATLVSAFMESTSYCLDNWKNYFKNAKIISENLGVSSCDESKALELFVLHTVNNVYSFRNNSLKIKALVSNDSRDPTYLTDDTFESKLLSDEDNYRIINNLKVKMKIRGQSSKNVWGDNDVIICLTLNDVIQQFCIVSCKLSLRERIYQSLFWSMHSRLEGTGKHVFITPDKGNNDKSEIGNRDINNKARKTRDVLESTMDRIYVLRNEDEVNRSQSIKGMEKFETDLKNWANDIAGNSI